MRIKHTDVHCDLLIPMVESVRAGKTRPDDTNARFSIIFSIKLQGVTDQRMLKVKDIAERLPADVVRLEFAMHGNLASRKEDGTLKWDFAKVFGNVSAGMCNRPFYQFVLGLLENDTWVQKYCTRKKKSTDAAATNRASRARSTTQTSSRAQPSASPVPAS